MMTRHYPDVGNNNNNIYYLYCAFSIKYSKAQVVTRHQYGISALVSQTSFGGETSGSVAICRLYSQANCQTGLQIYNTTTVTRATKIKLTNRIAGQQQYIPTKDAVGQSTAHTKTS